MSSVYKSKIGLELLIPIVLVFGTVLVLSIINEPNWVALLILLPVLLFMVHMFLTTNYTIDNEMLIVKCGFFFSKTIPIHEITKISETNNPISSPAISLDRIEIRCGKFDSVIISPKQKVEFINHLKSINPNIELKFKKMQFVKNDI